MCICQSSLYQQCCREKREFVDKFLKKEIVQNKDGSHTENWDCWGDCWWYTQEDNKLFRTGAFRKEYGDCGLGPKCPNHPNRVQDSMKNYKDRFLLPVDFPIKGLQNAINGFVFEKEYKHANLESSSAHLGTRAVKYDLNFSSLPCIFSVRL